MYVCDQSAAGPPMICRDGFPLINLVIIMLS